MSSVRYASKTENEVDVVVSKVTLHMDSTERFQFY